MIETVNQMKASEPAPVGNPEPLTAATKPAIGMGRQAEGPRPGLPSPKALACLEREGA